MIHHDYHQHLSIQNRLIGEYRRLSSEEKTLLWRYYGDQLDTYLWFNGL